MILDGLPDFARPLIFSRGRGYYRYHQDGAVVLPHSVELPVNETKLPKFGLQLLRPSFPFGGGRGHAILSVVLQPNFDLESARDYFDQLEVATPLQACGLADGQVCFSSPQHFSNTEIADELESSRALNVYGVSEQKLVMHLSSLAGSLWKQLIKDGVLLIDTKLTYRISGVSPRFNYTLQFEPKKLLTSIHTALEKKGLKVNDAVSVASLLSIVDENIETLPITVRKNGGSTAAPDIPELLDQIKRPLFFDSVVDHIIDRFSLKTHIYKNDLLVALARAEDFDTATFEWNMSEALLTQRLCSITASPFDAATSQLSESQLAELIEEKELPFIGSNKTQLSAYANFAERAKGVLSVGANVHQDASPPERPVPLNKGIEFTGQDEAAKIFLHNASDNILQYTYEGVVVIETDKGIIHCQGNPTQSSEKILVLNPRDFSVTAIPFSLDSAWHNLIEAEITLQFEYQGREHKVDGVLQARNSSIQFFVPEEASNVVGTVSLKDIASGKSLDIELSGLSGMDVNHFAFLECGKQTIKIVGEFTDDASWRAVELRPVSHEHDANSKPSLVHLTPSNPETFWHWFSQSPFDAAYQYRALNHLGNPMHAWRTVEYPYPDLILGESSNHNIEPTVVTGSI